MSHTLGCIRKKNILMTHHVDHVGPEIKEIEISEADQMKPEVAAAELSLILKMIKLYSFLLLKIILQWLNLLPVGFKGNFRFMNN